MTAVCGQHGRRFAFTGAGLVAVALVAAGCAEDRRFARQGATKETKALVVPARITPPVTVARIEGAPKFWQLNARVAQALRDRDVPAGTESRSQASYVVNGRAERLAPADGSAAPRLRIAWTLHDARGKTVGSALQIAVHPVAAGARLDADIDRKIDPVALDRLARSAAERLTPLVPRTEIGKPGVRKAGRTDDPIWRRVAGAPAPRHIGPPVTALGKQDAKQGGRGLSGRFLKLRNVTTVASRSPEARIATKRRTTRPQPGEPKPGEPQTAEPKPAGKRAAAPVVKPAAAEGSALGKRSAVTENIAYLATPGKPGKSGAGGARPVPAAKPRVVPVAATNRRSHRTEALRKSAVIRPAPAARKFPAPRKLPVTNSGAGTARPVQLAEAAGGRDDGAVQGFWVQLASNPSPKASREAWDALVARHGELLERQPHAINRADLGRKGVYYRLQLGPYPNIAQAKRVCAALRAARVTCLLMAARQPASTRTVTESPAPKAETKTRKPDAAGEAATGTAGKASAIKPSAGDRKTKPDPETAAKPEAKVRETRARRAAGPRPKADPEPGPKPGPKPGIGARAEKPKTQADTLPFQRSKALPGLPD